MVEDFDSEGREPGGNIRSYPADILIPVKLRNETLVFLY